LRIIPFLEFTETILRYLRQAQGDNWDFLRVHQFWRSDIKEARALFDKKRGAHMQDAYKAVKISDPVYWVGAIDWNIRDFHGYTTQRGSAYNAYLIPHWR
jgi:hypothetical protein